MIKKPFEKKGIRTSGSLLSRCKGRGGSKKQGSADSGELHVWFFIFIKRINVSCYLTRFHINRNDGVDRQADV
jgi:hypothetical protein